MSMKASALPQDSGLFVCNTGSSVTDAPKVPQIVIKLQNYWMELLLVHRFFSNLHEEKTQEPARGCAWSHV